MSKIRIGFGKPHSGLVPLSWAIKWVEGIPYSHAYLRFTDRDGVEKIFDSTLKGVTQITAEEFDKQYQILEEYEFQFTEQQMLRFEEFRKRFIGKPYTFCQLIGTLVAEKIGLDKNPLSSGTDRVVCAELLLYFIRDFPEVFTGHERIKTSPDMVRLKVLRDFINAMPGVHRVA